MTYLKKGIEIRHEFVEFVPKDMAERTLYVSIPYSTVVHKCLCGCGSDVVTPLSPTDWELCFDGETVSLEPSVGNWALPCKSHYWIESNVAYWAPQWTDDEIEAGRAEDKRLKKAFYSGSTPRVRSGRLRHRRLTE